MASIINASSSGSGGIVQTADASGVLQLQSNGTTSLQVDTSGNVGIGTTSANGYKLAIGDGSSNRGRIYLKGATGGNYPEINIDDTMNSSGKNYQIYSTGGVLKTSNQTDGVVSFVSNAFGIGLGDNAAVDGTGIRFPATQSASTNANTLDDYEEGTWTPVFKCTSVNPTYTASSAIGKYTKIGNVVYYSFYLYASGGATGGSGDVYIGNLPFNALADGRHPRALPSYLYWGSANKWAADGRNGIGWVAAGGPDLYLYASSVTYANGVFEMGGTGFYYV